MNPYLNSINGWGAGFIAFWVSISAAAKKLGGGGKSVKGIKREIFTLEPIGEIINGREIIYSDAPLIHEDINRIQQAIQLLDREKLELESTINEINQYLGYLRVIKKKEKNKTKLVIVNTLDFFDDALLLLLANN